MNWLSENYKWVFDGIGAAVLVGLIAWLWRRFFKEPAENVTGKLKTIDQLLKEPICATLGPGALASR